MRRFAILAALTLLLAGCRTYVGSTDLFETGPAVDDVAHAERERETFGLIWTMRGGTVTVRFGTEYDRRHVRKQVVRQIGREYFYLDKTDNVIDTGPMLTNPLGIPFALIAWPFAVFADTMDLLCGKPWHFHGGNRPGAGYLAAYSPPVSWFTAIALRPPYAYKTGKLLSEKDLWQDPAEEIHETEIRQTFFAPDAAGSEVRIEGERASIAGKMDASGAFTFTPAELQCTTVRGEPLEFRVRHSPSGRTWRVTTSPVIDPEELRDWNILADETLDPRSRTCALLRLRPVFGEDRVVELARRLLSGRPLDLPALPHGSIQIRSTWFGR
ncbi:MAG: hypothetical protein IJU70_09625 [Lentisphaeria bacterium]|nr:hypothetical protein [Lentisphaeria bacterium]